MGTSGNDEIRALLERELSTALAAAPTALRELLIDRLGGLLHYAVECERKRCVDLCRQRAALWRTTRMAQSTLRGDSEEARARVNEAEYLADALELPGGLAT